jgi:hypothetical protein
MILLQHYFLIYLGLTLSVHTFKSLSQGTQNKGFSVVNKITKITKLTRKKQLYFFSSGKCKYLIVCTTSKPAPTFGLYIKIIKFICACSSMFIKLDLIYWPSICSNTMKFILNRNIISKTYLISLFLYFLVWEALCLFLSVCLFKLFFVCCK